MSLPLTPRLPAQKDNHQGCLGHGDKAGKLTPTRSAATGCWQECWRACHTASLRLWTLWLWT